jgi:DNA-binding NarL/FixJ family response regulator
MTLTLEVVNPDVSGDRRVAGTSVVVQQRQRLFREGIAQLLGAEDDIDIVTTATSDGDLLRECHEHRPQVVVMEADITDWDPFRLAVALRRVHPRLAVVGLGASEPTVDQERQARHAGMTALVSRQSGITGILAAVRAAGESPLHRPLARMRSTVPGSQSVTLTDRELGVLSLVGAGLTSAQISRRLQISHKTVENHKQRIFAKLGVQNQAHAVSVALRAGLLRPERVIDLAVGD